MRSITIDARFNGPPSSANGGYTCGLIAREIAGPAVVTLRKPPPLGRALALSRQGEQAVLLDGDEVVADAEPTGSAPAGEIPEPVSLEQARAAETHAAFRDERQHPFPTCFVCGPRRDEGDGLRIFAGPVRQGLFASTWTPAPSVLDGGGAVPPEIVWAALDCPTSAPVLNKPDAEGRVLPIVLARLAVELREPVLAGVEHVVTSWEIGRDGRKREAGAALFTADGRLLASARALWIELRPSQSTGSSSTDAA